MIVYLGPPHYGSAIPGIHTYLYQGRYQVLVGRWLISPHHHQSATLLSCEEAIVRFFDGSLEGDDDHEGGDVVPTIRNL
jgi:hypothetical protein